MVYILRESPPPGCCHCRFPFERWCRGVFLTFVFRIRSDARRALISRRSIFAHALERVFLARATTTSFIIRRLAALRLRGIIKVETGTPERFISKTFIFTVVGSDFIESCYTFTINFNRFS